MPGVARQGRRGRKADGSYGKTIDGASGADVKAAQQYLRALSEALDALGVEQPFPARLGVRAFNGYRRSCGADRST